MMIEDEKKWSREEVLLYNLHQLHMQLESVDPRYKGCKLWEKQKEILKKCGIVELWKKILPDGIKVIGQAETRTVEEVMEEFK